MRPKTSAIRTTHSLIIHQLNVDSRREEKEDDEHWQQTKWFSDTREF